MNIELSILDWIQTLHTPFLDKIMVFITRLGDAGIIWIVLSIVLLLIPKTRKSGAVMVAASGKKTAGLFVSVRTYGSFVCFGNNFVPGR